MPAACPVSLVVTDLDGTLWHTDDHVHAEVVRALGVLGERDIPLLVATGRRLGSATAPLASVGVTLPMVVLNGALGVDVATGERFRWTTTSRESCSCRRATRPIELPDELVAVFRTAVREAVSGT